MIGHCDQACLSRNAHGADRMQTEIRLEGAASESLLGAVTVFSTQLAAGFVTLQGSALSLAACGNPIEEDLAAPVAVNIRELHERLVLRAPAALGLRKLLSPADFAAGIENRQDAVAERPMMRIARRQKSDEHQRNQGSAGEQACCHEPESALAGASPASAGDASEAVFRAPPEATRSSSSSVKATTRALRPRPSRRTGRPAVFSHRWAERTVTPR